MRKRFNPWALSNDQAKAVRAAMFVIVKNYPVGPGDVLDRGSTADLKRRGMIVKDSAGNWIPTAMGLLFSNAAAGLAPDEAAIFGIIYRA